METHTQKLIVTHVSFIGCGGKSDLYSSIKKASGSYRNTAFSHLADMDGSIWHMKVADAEIRVTSDFILGHEAVVGFVGPEERGFIRGTINFGFEQSVLAISCWPEGGQMRDGFWTKLYTNQRSTPEWLKGAPMRSYEFGLSSKSRMPVEKTIV